MPLLTTRGGGAVRGFGFGGAAFKPVVATGGTETTDGDYKIHTFTGPGTFTVTDAGEDGLVDYLVVAGVGS